MKLRPHLKNFENMSSNIGKAERVKHPAHTFIETHPEYPSYPERLDWLRQMRIPGTVEKTIEKVVDGKLITEKKIVQYTKDGKDVPLILPGLILDKDGKAKPLEGLTAGEKKDAIERSKGWFALHEKNYMVWKGRHGEQLADVKDFQPFHKSLNAEDYEALRTLSEQVKIVLKEKGLIGEDTGLMKFDTKDSPLSFYQEGADILGMEQYLKACLCSGTERKDFAQAFCGNTPDLTGEKPYTDANSRILQKISDQGTRRGYLTNNSHLEPRAARFDRISQSQLAAVVWAVGKESIIEVMHDFAPATPKSNSWLGGKMYDGSLRQDLLDVYKKTVGWEKPIPQVIKEYAQVQGKAASPEHALG
jgi:hypothetical protein